MELGFADSLEYICFDSCPASYLSLSDKENCNPPHQPKHVTFAPSPVVSNFPIQELTVPADISAVQPVSILKETNYKYSPYHQYISKFSDLFYLLLAVSLLTFCDKLLKLFS